MGTVSSHYREIKMQCKRGIFIKTQNQTVPCGQCMPCRINKGRVWSGRIILEQSAHWSLNGQRSYFVTLTYSDANCPRTVEGDPTLRKKETLKWLNNEMSGRDKSGAFRYYLVGEYGDTTRRPHYHMALFPGPNFKLGQFLGRWQERRGFTQIDEITHARARYLANYTAKKLTKADDDRLLPGQEPEFRTSSRRPPIGHDFIEVLVRQYTTRAGSKVIAEHGDIERTFRVDGKIYPIAPYILNRAREELGIPLLHRDRIAANDNYLKFHEVQEAIWNPKEAKAQQIQFDAEQRRKRANNAKV